MVRPIPAEAVKVVMEEERQWVEVNFRSGRPYIDSVDLQSLEICRIASGPARRIRICASMEHIRIQLADKRIYMQGSMSDSPGCK